MERIIKTLNNQLNLKIDISKQFLLISVFGKNGIGLSSIFCNFNSERMSYSYIDFRDMINRKERYVSKKKLFEFIADLIKYPNLKYKKINEYFNEFKKVWYMDITELYKQSIKKFGRDKQLIIAIEELSELIKEITKYLRGIGNKQNISEEIADCSIMIEEIIQMFNINEEVKNWYKYKLIVLYNLIH